MANGTNSLARARAPYAQRPCEYMNCRRPQSAHRWSVSGKRRPVEAGAR
jgi:hypothetical protein